MTPFGARLRQLREERGMALKDMAAAVGVSAAYLSSLEHGRRGKPTWLLLQRIIGHLNIIWDDAEDLRRLAGLSHPRVVIDTQGLSPQATEVANRLAGEIALLDSGTLLKLLAVLDRANSHTGE